MKTLWTELFESPGDWQLHVELDERNERKTGTDHRISATLSLAGNGRYTINVQHPVAAITLAPKDLASAKKLVELTAIGWLRESMENPPPQSWTAHPTVPDCCYLLVAGKLDGHRILALATLEPGAVAVAGVSSFGSFERKLVRGKGAAEDDLRFARTVAMDLAIEEMKAVDQLLRIMQANRTP